MRIRRLVPLLAATGGAMVAISWWVTRRTAPLPTGTAALAVVPEGRPRIVRVAGGSVPHGEPASRGVEQEVPLLTGTARIGRSRHCELRFHEATVSLEHAELDISRDGHVVVRDTGSENGVRVDGVPIVERELYDGNRLAIGEVILVFKSDLAAGSTGRQGGELG